VEEGDLPQFSEDTGQRGDIHGREATKSPQEIPGADVEDHFLGVRVRQRCAADGVVLQRLREDAAEAEEDAGTEGGEPRHPGDEFPLPADHSLDQNRHIAAGRCPDAAEGRPDIVVGCQAQGEEPFAAFMRYPPRTGLGRDRIADLPGGACGLVLALRKGLPGHGDLVPREDALGLMLVEGLLPVSFCLRQERLRFGIGRGKRGCRPLLPFTDPFVPEKGQHGTGSLFRRIEDGDVMVHIGGRAVVLAAEKG